MNAGVQFLEKSANYTWDCYVFHDVDLLVESPKGLYKCLDKYPRHLSSSIDKYHYTVPWNGMKFIELLNRGGFYRRDGYNTGAEVWL